MASLGLSSAFSLRTTSFTGAKVGIRQARTVASRSSRLQVYARDAAWAPGGDAPAHLDGSLPGDYGFDPFCLGADKEKLLWYREAELQHARWAMLGAAGILVQDIFAPGTLYYNAAAEASLPFGIAGLVGVQFLLMHWVEVRRWRDFVKPNSVNKDPIFGNELPDHEPGYPGGIFNPLNFGDGDLSVLKVKEINNGRLAMVSYTAFIIQTQATGKGPLENLFDHLADPLNTTIFSTIFSKGGYFHFSGPGCAIPPSVEAYGITIPTPCLPIFGV